MVRKLLAALAQKVKTHWDDILVEKKFLFMQWHIWLLFFNRNIMPIVKFNGLPTFVRLCHPIEDIYLIVCGAPLWSIVFLLAAQLILSGFELFRDKPLEKVIFQLS